MLSIVEMRDANGLDQYYPMVETIYKHVLNHFDKDDTTMECSLILVDETMMHQYNYQYRHMDRPTDVLTFAALEGEQLVDENELGDIFINTKAVYDQAKAYGHSVRREFCFLFVHGLLHTLGYDHMNPHDETIMFALQDELLDPLVSKDEPYQEV